MSLIIRKALVTDAESLVKLILVLGYKVGLEEVGVKVGEILNKKDHCLLVAVNDKEIIGFIHWFLKILLPVSKTVEVGGLAVFEKWQGKGIGKKLINELEIWVKKEGIKRIVIKSNIIRTKTHEFYIKAGYKVSKTQRVFEKIF